MSPTRSRKNPDGPFEQGMAEFQALTEESPVDNSTLFEVTSNLENTGLTQMGSKELTGRRFAEAMHAVFIKISEMEVVPPLDEAQTNLVAGKVATYAAMQEATAPKKRVSRKKATDTSDIPTDKPKP